MKDFKGKLTILLFNKGKPFWIFNQFIELLEETNDNNWVICDEKEGEIKQQMVNVAKPYHQATWKQKTCQKRESYRKCFDFKIFPWKWLT